MRKSFTRFAAWALVSGVSMAAVAAVNLSEFDGEAMRVMDDAFKDLEPVLAASGTAIAKENLATLKGSYEYTLEYFTGQEKEGKEGMALLKAGIKLLDEIEAAVNKRDFTGAVARTRELQANCKSCHEKFRPKK